MSCHMQLESGWQKVLSQVEDVRLASEIDIERWTQMPLTDDESAIGPLADCGPAEDWSDWADAAR